MNFLQCRSSQQSSSLRAELTPFSAFLEGLQAVIPALLGILPFSMISGVAAVNIGIPPFSALAMSILVFAGASQLVVIDLIQQHGLPVVIILTGLVMNLRFTMYSASLALHIRHAATKWKMFFAYLLTDQAFVVSIARFQRGYPEHLKGWYYFGTALSLAVVWQIGAATGIFLGSQIPESWSLDFAVPLIFLSMLIPAVKDRASKAAAIVSGVTAILAASLPLNLGLLVASGLGILVGLLFERSTTTPHANRD